jgi:tetratricopeptide (TPR) repeat protein
LDELLNELPASERRVDRDLVRSAPNESTCYVAISDRGDNGVFSMAIVPALAGSGLLPVRRDPHAPVTSSSRAQIEAADLVIGDVSSRENRVLYELGVAHALGKPMILLAQEGADVPLELAHFRILEHRPSDPGGFRKLRRTLTDAIRLTVTDVNRLKSDRSDVTKDYEPDDLVERANQAQREGRLNDAAELLEQAAGALDERADYANAAALYNNLASVYQSLGLYSRALIYIQRSIDLQQRTNNTPGEAVATGNLASIFDALGDLDQAQASYHRAIQLAQSAHNDALLGSLFNNLGQLYTRQRRIVDAEEVYRRALEIFAATNNARWTGSTLSNLAALKQSLGQVNEAGQLLNRALAIFRKLDDKESVARVLHNLGALQVEAGNSDEGEQLIRQSIKIKDQIGDKAGQASALVNLAQNEINRGDWATAVNHLLRATSIQQLVGDRYGLMVSLSLTSTILEASGSREKAVEFLDRALTIATDLNVPERASLDKRLARLKLAVPSGSSET